MSHDDATMILAALQARQTASAEGHPSGHYDVRFVDLRDVAGLAEAAAVGLADTGEEAAPPTSDAKGAERLKDHLQNVEIEQIKKALASAAGNQSAAARTLHMKRSTLLSKMKKHGL